jgi:hypothetical protein
MVPMMLAFLGKINTCGTHVIKSGRLFMYSNWVKLILVTLPLIDCLVSTHESLLLVVVYWLKLTIRLWNCNGRMQSFIGK